MSFTTSASESPAPTTMGDARVGEPGSVAPKAESLPVEPSSFSTLLITLRWVTLVAGGVVAGANDRAVNPYVITVLAAATALALWRTLRPIRIETMRSQKAAVFDLLVTGFAVGATGMGHSPLTAQFVLLAGIVTLGWGSQVGATALIEALLLGVSGWMAAGFPPVRPIELVALTSVVAVAVPTAASIRVSRSIPALRGPNRTEAADALAELNRQLARLEGLSARVDLPLDRRALLEAITARITEDFSPTVLALLEPDARSDSWVPKLATGCALPPSLRTASLPAGLRQAVDTRTPVLSTDLSPAVPGLAPSSTCGIYVPMFANNTIVGALAFEHPVVGRYGPLDLTLATELTDELGLAVDNARRLARLRTLVTDAGETRLVRELHDRLGQWLTLMSFELEAVIRDQDAPSEDLNRLYGNVQSAIEEMRDSLRQILSGVAPDRPLSRVGREMCERFTERTDIDVVFTCADPTQRLPLPIEIELGRILHEALTNCEQHANATSVNVTWTVHGLTGALTVADNGVGFDLNRAIRDNARGLIDMQERADAIGALLSLDSTPTSGTTVIVAVTAATNEEK